MRLLNFNNLLVNQRFYTFISIDTNFINCLDLELQLIYAPFTKLK